MLTFHVRDHTGALAYDESVPSHPPVTITVTPSFAPPSTIPLGPETTIVRRPRRTRLGRQPTPAELERLVDRVVAWSGWTQHGTPLACTRRVVLGVLTQAPWIRRQVEDAIREASTVGLTGPPQ